MILTSIEPNFEPFLISFGYLGNGLEYFCLVYDRNFGFGLEVRQKQGFGRVRWFGRNGVSVNRNRTFNLRQCWPLLHCLRMKSHEEKKHFSWKNILFLSERVSNIDFHNKYAPWRCNMNSFSRFKNEKL